MNTLVTDHCVAGERRQDYEVTQEAAAALYHVSKRCPILDNVRPISEFLRGPESVEVPRIEIGPHRVRRHRHKRPTSRVERRSTDLAVLLSQFFQNSLRSVFVGRCL